MIPDFNHSHVLPPFLGDGPTTAADVSPYSCSMLEVTQRFASMPGRRQLIKGLLNYRADLAALSRMSKHVSNAHLEIWIL